MDKKSSAHNVLFFYIFLVLSLFASLSTADIEEAVFESIKAYWEHLNPDEGHGLCKAVGLAFLNALDEDEGWEAANMKAKEMFVKASSDEAAFSSSSPACKSARKTFEILLSSQTALEPMFECLGAFASKKASEDPCGMGIERFMNEWMKSGKRGMEKNYMDSVGLMLEASMTMQVQPTPECAQGGVKTLEYYGAIMAGMMDGRMPIPPHGEL